MREAGGAVGCAFRSLGSTARTHCSIRVALDERAVGCDGLHDVRGAAFARCDDHVSASGIHETWRARASDRDDGRPRVTAREARSVENR